VLSGRALNGDEIVAEAEATFMVVPD